MKSTTVSHSGPVKPRNRRQFHISDLSEYADPRNQRHFHTLDVGDHEIDDSFTFQITDTTKSTTVPHSDY